MFGHKNLATDKCYKNERTFDVTTCVCALVHGDVSIILDKIVIKSITLSIQRWHNRHFNLPKISSFAVDTFD